MAHGEEGEHLEALSSHKLRLIKSPTVGTEKLASEETSVHHVPSQVDLETLGYRDGPGHDCPEFQRHEEATNIELFFDLFFAANLTVFSEVHDVTDSGRLSSYIAYFCMLWFTWAIVGLFDVRFVTDSIFERVARSAHLGVMVGFAVVAPLFNPTDQTKSTFRTMSLIMMVSRLTLMVQYASIIWHVRKYKKTRVPLGLMVGLNFVAAMIYLGITFRFEDHNSRVYIAWYIIAIFEIGITIGLSLWYEVLSFKGTHLINRMSLLTMIIIGEGIITVSINVTLIVKNANLWTPATIGVVTAAVANLYIFFQIYFDWMRHLHLPPVRQLIWAFMHFPFHLALTLFVEGSSQFVTWWKITETLYSFIDDINGAFAVVDDPNFNVTTAWYVGVLNDTANAIFALYTPKYYDTYVDVNDAINKLSTINDSFWSSDVTATDPVYELYNNATNQIYLAVSNSLLASFDIDGIANVGQEGNFTGDGVAFETAVDEENWNRFILVFNYTFVCAGIVLILMNILYIISRLNRWTPFNYFRTAVNFLVGIGLCLIALVTLNQDTGPNYEFSPWLLPTLCLTFFFILVLNHLPHPPPLFFLKRQHTHGGAGGGGHHHRHNPQRAESFGLLSFMGHRKRPSEPQDMYNNSWTGRSPAAPPQVPNPVATGQQQGSTFDFGFRNVETQYHGIGEAQAYPGVNTYPTANTYTQVNAYPGT